MQVHCNTFSDEELKILANSGASITATPEVEIQMGYGFPVTGRYQRLGGLSSIGVDVECDISGDMFQVMRFALQTQRLLDNTKTIEAGMSIEELSFNARDAFAWTTIDGARAIGLDQKIGSLNPGKQADLSMFRKNDLNLYPVNDPLETVVFQCFHSNVDSVMIAGKFVKKNGVLEFSDLDQKKSDLANSAQRILEAAGLRA